MIPTYNCARYLAYALESVLRQDLGPEVMQIEVVDDFSTKDNPEKVVNEVGSGRVGFYRQPSNCGHVANFRACLRMSQGHLVHLLHGDDAVRPGFYARMTEIFAGNPNLGAAFTRQIFMDEAGDWLSISPKEQEASGIMPDLLQRLAFAQRIQTPSIVVRREVYENLGTFDRRLNWTEDWEMWTRISANYPVWYELEPLALYRSHTTSSTSHYSMTGENTRDVGRFFAVVAEYLCPEDRLITKNGRQFYARLALEAAAKLAREGEFLASFFQAREAMRLCRNPRLVRPLIYFAGVFTKHLVLQSSRRLTRDRSERLSGHSTEG